MPTSQAFRRTFAAAVVIGFIDWAVPIAAREKMLFLGFWLGYALLAIFGFLAVREGRRYGHVFALTWVFVGFWFLLGLLDLAGELPSDWPPEEALAFDGYLVATTMFLPLAFASSGIGFAAARLLSKLRNEPPSAA